MQEFSFGLSAVLWVVYLEGLDVGGVLFHGVGGVDEKKPGGRGAPVGFFGYEQIKTN